MDGLLELGASNAAAAVVLAAIAAVLSPFCKNPKLRHALWLLVLVKLVTPPLFPVPVSVPVPDWVQGLDHDPAPAARSDEGGLPVRLGPLQEDSRSLDPFVAVDERPAIDRRAPSPRPTPAEPTRFVANNRVEEAGPKSPSHAASAVPVQPPRPTGRAEGTESVATHESSALVLSGRNLRLIAAAVWIVGSSILVVVLAIRVRRFRRLIAATEIAGGTARAEAEQTANRVGLARCPTVRMVDGPIPPMVWSGGLRPVLLLPRELWRTLASRERQLLLAHELMHVRRGDHWIRRFESFVLAIYWWHPVAWWASRRLQQAEEECCDAAVIAGFPQDVETYGETLLVVCDFVARGTALMPVLSSGFGREKHLKRRLTMILGDQGPQQASRFVTLSASVLGLLGIVCSWNVVVAQKGAPVVPDAAVDQRTAGDPFSDVSGASSPQFVSPSGGLAAAPLPSQVLPSPQGQPVYRRSNRGTRTVTKWVPMTVTRMVPVTETIMVANGQGTPLLSGNVQKQLIEKLLEGVKDSDAGVARQSLEGLARAGQADVATQALLALLDRAADARDAQIGRLALAGQLLAAGIAPEKVVAFLTKVAADSGDKLVRIRAIGTLVASAAGNTSADVVRMLIATAEKRDAVESSPTSASGSAKPKTAATTGNGGDSPNGDKLPADAALINALIGHAQVDREPRVDSVVFETVRGSVGPTTVVRTRVLQHAVSPDGRIEREMTKLIGEFNEAFNGQRWADAEKIGLRASALDSRHQAAITMLEKARAALNAARVIESAGSNSATPSESLSGAAIFALEQVVPQVDEVAVALMEALSHKDPQIRRAAAHALANAVRDNPNFGRPRVERVGERIGEKEGYEEATRRFERKQEFRRREIEGNRS